VSTDALGRNRAPKITDLYGACRCCEKWFVEKGGKVKDADTEAHHYKDGHCSTCYKNLQRKGRCSHDNPASLYRCPFTNEQNIDHLIAFFARTRYRKTTTP
jgi:hypothetical protein